MTRRKSCRGNGPRAGLTTAQPLVSMDPLGADPPPQPLGRLPGSPLLVRSQGMVRQIAGALRSIYPGWLTPRAGARWARAGGAAAAGGFRGPGGGTGPGRGGHRQGAGGAAVAGDDRRRSGVGKTALARRCLAEAEGTGLRVLPARADQPRPIWTSGSSTSCCGRRGGSPARCARGRGRLGHLVFCRGRPPARGGGRAGGQLLGGDLHR